MESKPKYTAPDLEMITLDNVISLVLESSPPLGPDETYNQISTAYFFNNNTYKSNA